MKKLLLFILTMAMIFSCITSCSNSAKLSDETVIGTWEMKASAAEFISLNEDNFLKENFEIYLPEVDFSGTLLTFTVEFFDDGSYTVSADEKEPEKEITNLYNAVFEAFERDKDLAIRLMSESVSEEINEQEFDDIIEKHGYTYDEYISAVKQAMNDEISDLSKRYISEMKYGGSYFVETTENNRGNIYFDKEKTQFAAIEYEKTDGAETIKITSSNMPFFSHSEQLIRVK